MKIKKIILFPILLILLMISLLLSTTSLTWLILTEKLMKEYKK